MKTVSWHSCVLDTSFIFAPPTFHRLSLFRYKIYSGYVGPFHSIWYLPLPSHSIFFFPLIIYLYLPIYLILPIYFLLPNYNYLHIYYRLLIYLHMPICLHPTLTPTAQVQLHPHYSPTLFCYTTQFPNTSKLTRFFVHLFHRVCFRYVVLQKIFVRNLYTVCLLDCLLSSTSCTSSTLFGFTGSSPSSLRYHLPLPNNKVSKHFQLYPPPCQKHF